jgi:hypothetical protein
MELRALITQACNKMCRRVINSITVCVEEFARHNCGHIEHLIACSGISFGMLLSSIVIEIKILLIDQIWDHFMRHSVQGRTSVGGSMTFGYILVF